ncbi:hypothetical protein ACKLNO_04940 [Neisseriaceae bacterium B1]
MNAGSWLKLFSGCLKMCRLVAKLKNDLKHDECWVLPQPTF